MIQQQTIVKILDNSGAKNVKCIQCIAGKRFSRLGGSIVVTVKELRTKSRRTSKVLKGEVHTAIITTTKSAFRRKDGSILYSGNNSAVKNEIIDAAFDFQSKIKREVKAC